MKILYLIKLKLSLFCSFKTPVNKIGKYILIKNLYVLIHKISRFVVVKEI